MGCHLAISSKMKRRERNPMLQLCYYWGMGGDLSIIGGFSSIIGEYKNIIDCEKVLIYSSCPWSLRIIFSPLCFYTCSMVMVIAVVISPGLVHITPMVFGSSFILVRTRRRREIAGALCLSHVTVVLIIDLLWSENSTSCQCILTDIQNSALFTTVLTEGKYIDDVQDPISKIRLEEIIPCCWFLW